MKKTPKTSKQKEKQEIILLHKRSTVDEAFRSEIKMFFDRLSTSQAIDHTLNTEKCKFSENYEKEESCLCGVQVRSKPLLIETEWPLVTAQNFKGTEISKMLRDLHSLILEKPYWLCFFPSDFHKPVIVEKRCWCTVSITSTVTKTMF